MYNSNDVHTERFETKNSKKKKNVLCSTELNTYSEHKSCEEDIEQNTTDYYSRKNVSQKGKFEINALADISLGNNCSMDNENVATKKPKKKKQHNKSLNTTTEAAIKSFERTSVEVNGQNIKDSDFRENVKKLRSKKSYIESLNLIELNTINDTKIKTLDRTCEAVNNQNIIDSYSKKNVSRKRKFDLNALADISIGDNCSIDNENVPTKKKKDKKNHYGSLNSIEFNTNHGTNIQIFERTSEVVNDQNINNSDFRENVNQTIKSKLNTSSDISSENKYCMYYENVPIMKTKKKKKHDKSLDFIKLNTNYDAVNDSDSTINKSQKRISEINALPTKKPKKKKNHSESLNSIELDKINHDTQTQIFERTYEEVNDQNINNSDFRENVNQTIKSNNVVTKKLKKKRNHNTGLNSIDINTNNDADYKTNEKDNEHNFNDSDSTKNLSQKRMSQTKKPKKKKNHSKSLNSIELDKINHDTETQIFERTFEEVNDQNINDFDYRENVNQIKNSELNTLSDILLENKLSMYNDNVVTKKPKKKKKHNTSLNSIDINTNNDAVYKTYEKDNEHNINDSDSTKNISQKRMSQTKKPKKKKNHSKSLNSIELDKMYRDTETQVFERTFKKVNEQSINDSDYRENVNQTIKSEFNTSSDISLENKYCMDYDNVPIMKPKKKKKHDKSLDLIKLNTNNDAVNDSDSTINKSKKKMSELNALPTKKPKRKKNHNESLNSIELDKINHDTQTQIFERTYEEVNDQNINNSDFRENVNQTKKPKRKKKHSKSLNSIELDKINHDTQTQIFERTYEEVNDQNINNSDFRENVNQTKKPKRKKKHSKSLNSIELDKINHDTETQIFEKTLEEVNDQNINDFDYGENVNQLKKPELNTLSDILLENKFDMYNDNVVTKKPKKKKKHNKSLNSIDINTNNYTEIKTNEKTCTEVSEPNMNDSDTKALASVSQEINHSINNGDLATKESEKRKKHDKITNNLSMPTISENQSRLKTLLNTMELCNFEESSSNNNTNFNLKRFNLLNYLTNKDPSLKNHPNFVLITSLLSSKINRTINKNSELKASDILLLKTIGKIILKKIVEKIDSAQVINNLVITLPPECMKNKIHFIGTTLSRLPDKGKLAIIKNHNPLLKLRIFNKDEDNMIREYWSKFQKEYNISSVLPFLSNGLEMALTPIKRLQFIRYISAGLPNRLLYSVYYRFNILFNEYQDKTWFSEEEDQLIMKVDKCDAIRNKFSVLSLILNRTRLQLYRRHEVLKNQQGECTKIVWNDQMRQELFTNILLETNTEHWTHLRNLTLTKDVLIKIAKNLGENITYKKVRYQWNHLYTMLFCEKTIPMSTFNLTVLKLLEEINPKHWSDLNWIEITNKLYPGANSKVICSFFHTWIDKKVPSNIKENVRDTLDYLKWNEVEKLKNRIKKRGEREFPRLTVKYYDLLVDNQ